LTRFSNHVKLEFRGLLGINTNINKKM
jgi:hypothetical protein